MTIKEKWKHHFPCSYRCFWFPWWRRWAVFPLHIHFLGLGCVVMAPGLVTRNDTIQKCRILLIMDQVLQTEAQSSFLIIKGQVFWYPYCTYFAEPQMLVDNGVSRSFSQVEFVADFMDRNSSISLDHFINGIIGDHLVCLIWSWQIWCNLPFLHGNLLSPFFDKCPYYDHLLQLENMLLLVVLIWMCPWIPQLSFHTI